MKGLLVITFLLGLTLTTFSYLFVDVNLTYLNGLYTGIATTYRLHVTAFYVLLLACFFAVYLYVLRRVTVKKLAFTNIKSLLITVLLVVLFAYPAYLSYDIFNYIATAKVLFMYGENPYIMMPVDFPNDPMLSFTRAANKVALYGPAWILLTGIPFLIGGGNFLLTLFAFKAFILLFFTGTLFLIWRITNSLFSLTLFALNPLVLLEVVSGGHNDVVMVFFALLAFYLLTRKYILPAVIFLCISILIKYASVFLLPVFVYACWKVLRNETVRWGNVYFYATLSMYVIFLLSPLREEMYPWYGIWFLSFAVLIPERKKLLAISMLFSFALMLRYVPFMATGNYFGNTPVVRELLTFFPVTVGIILLHIQKKWRTELFRF